LKVAAMNDPEMLLWHLPPSHYSEKVRWALEYKRLPHRRRAMVPGAHMLFALWLTRGRNYTLPVLQLNGRAIGDSTAIIAALEERFPEPPLYPGDPAQRRRALELEEFFDEELAPHMRLFGFHELSQDKELFDELSAQIGPPALARFSGAQGAYARAFVALRFGVRDVDAAELARTRISAAFDRLEAELGDRQYLVGDSFTVADLSAAALLYPLVMPPEGPLRPARMPQPMEDFSARFAERPGYRWIQQMFARHRRLQPAAAMAGAGI
jgi:glutathione S-transferase